MLAIGICRSLWARMKPNGCDGFVAVADVSVSSRLAFIEIVLVYTSLQ
jgi:hypothetical protein